VLPPELHTMVSQLDRAPSDFAADFYLCGAVSLGRRQTRNRWVCGGCAGVCRLVVKCLCRAVSLGSAKPQPQHCTALQLAHFLT
jgi:hypothetical protein